MAEGDARPRRWWAALLLTLFGGGVGGYLYVGRPWRALIAGIAGLLIYVALGTGLSGWIATPAGFFGLAALAALVLLFVAVDSVRIAAGARSYVPRAYNRAWVYAAAVVASIGISFVVQPAVRSFGAASASMAPTLRPGDKFVVDLTRTAPRRGDVIVFALPRDPRIAYVSRVVGLPGERVQMVDGVLHIDGAPATLAESDAADATIRRETLPGGAVHLIADTELAGFLDNTPVFEVPADAYFVVSDNRDKAADSRLPAEAGGVGFVPSANVIGRATTIFWSPDWGRIGTAIE